MNVFFVVSGAMLTHSVLDRGLRRFARNRFLRIYTALIVSSAFTALFLGPFVGADPLGEPPLESLLRFSFAFLTGVVGRQLGALVPLRFGWSMAAVAMALAGTGTAFAKVCWIVGIGYMAIHAGGSSWGDLGTFARRHDLSCGIYLLAWPVQQVLTREPIWAGPQVLVLFVLSGTIAGGLAYLSWRWIETPTLQLKARAEEKVP